MKIEEFKAWLAQQGAEVLAPTNPYEVLRVRARGGVHIAYKDKHGIISWQGLLLEARQRFVAGARMDMGLTAVQRTPMARFRAALLERDGRECFFCLQDMPNDDMTVEHLVPVHKGGPNHMDNLVLAHGECNKKADNLPVIKKIGIREAAIGAEERGYA
jgi:hypothetical protein